MATDFDFLRIEQTSKCAKPRKNIFAVCFVNCALHQRHCTIARIDIYACLCIQRCALKKQGLERGKVRRSKSSEPRDLSFASFSEVAGCEHQARRKTQN